MIVTNVFTAEAQRPKVRRRILIHSSRAPRLRVSAVKCLLLGLTLLSESAFAQTDFASKLSASAIDLTKQKVYYDGTYFSIPYPNGDVPVDRGVCTDVVIRAYRKLGIDLQQKVHEDMKANFHLYPKNWGLKKTDTNIDHRRVPNLMTFFSRRGVKLKNTQNPADYKAGDLVTWDLGGNTPHIGIVIDQRSSDNNRPLIVHNIGAGQEISDCLFMYRITGHYRYAGQ